MCNPAFQLLGFSPDKVSKIKKKKSQQRGLKVCQTPDHAEHRTICFHRNGLGVASLKREKRGDAEEEQQRFPDWSAELSPPRERQSKWGC